MENVVVLAQLWLSCRRNGEVDGIEILPQLTAAGLVVWFYWADSFEDLPYFLTVPMVQSLLEGKNPKKVRNEYLK